MMSFSLSGGVEVLGFISPTDPLDTYPVIDPIYGIDGFRNVDLISDLDLIPNPRRRAGMVVGISGGTQYYKLNPSPWNGDITDWSVFNLGGLEILPFTSINDFPPTGSTNYLYLDQTESNLYAWDTSILPAPGDYTLLNSSNPPLPPDDIPLTFAKAATVGVLSNNPVYYNGPSNDGVGAIISGSTNGLISDGSSLGRIDYTYTGTSGDTILIKNQVVTTNPLTNKGFQNGLYTIIDPGSNTTPYILSRVSGFDQSSEMYPLQVNVLGGSNNNLKYFLQTTVNPTIGTSNIVFSISSTQNITYQIAFVDTSTSTALPACDYASGTTYSSSPGVGATLTAQSVGGPLIIDGLTASTSTVTNNTFNRVLVKDQTGPLAYQNGDYSVINPGSASARWQLRRINTSSGGFNRYTRFFIVSNTQSSKAGKSYFTTKNVPALTNATIGSAPINIVEYGGSGTFTGGTVSGATNFISGLTANTISATTFTANTETIVGRIPTGATGSVSTGTSPVGVYVQGKYAYVVNINSSTLQIFDTSTPSSPVLVGSVSTGTSPQNVYVQGRYAYVVNGSNALQIFDVSNPSLPVLVGSPSTGFNGVDIYVQGRYAYTINTSSNLLQIFDISNPSLPFLVGSSSTNSISLSLYVQGRYAYVINQVSNTLQIFDVSNPSSPSLVGTVSTGSSPNGVYVQGRYAYVVNVSSGTLQIFNISNPSSPTSVGSVLTGSIPVGVYVQGRYAYVINQVSNTLQIFDVSNPSSPSLVGTVSTGSSPNSVYVQGRYAYVVNPNSNTLQIFDVSGSYIQQLESGGILTSTLESVGNATIGNDLAVVGGLNVSQSTNILGNLSATNMRVVSGLTATTISATTYQNLPSSTNIYNTDGTLTGARSVNLSGNQLTFSSTTSGTNVIGLYGSGNTSTSRTYFEMGQRNNGGFSSSVFFTSFAPSYSGTSWGSFYSGSSMLSAYHENPVTTGGFGNLYFDISQFGSTVANRYFAWHAAPVTTARSLSTEMMRLHILGNGDGNLGINTKGVPTQKLHVSGNTLIEGSLTANTISATTYQNLPIDVRVTGGTYSSGTATFTNNTGGTFNVTGFSTGGTFTGGTVSGATNFTNGLTANTQSIIGRIPITLTAITTSVAFTNVYSQGNYLYAVGGGGGFQIFDVSRPSSPSLVGSATTVSSPYGVYVQGRYSYITNTGTNTLQIYDVSNPSSPTLVGSVSTGGNPIGVSVQGRYAYVVNSIVGKLEIFDVSNPLSPFSVGSVLTGGQSRNVFVQGRYAYVTTGGSLQIYDISNPSSPTFISFGVGFVAGWGIYVQGRYAYVVNASSSGQLHIVDVSNPSSQILVGSISTGSVSGPYDVYVQGRYAYVVNYFSNIFQTFDVSNPSSPTLVGSVSTGGLPFSLCVQGRYAYVVNTSSSPSILQTIDVGGSYIQQLEAGGILTSTLESVGNATIGNDLAVVGGLNVSQSTNILGNLSATNMRVVSGLTANTITLVGGDQVPSLNTTVSKTLTGGTNTIYSIPTSAYTGSFFDYTLISSGSTGARSGTIMSIWSGSTAQFLETSTPSIGSTTDVTFSVAVSGGNAVLSSSATTAGWVVKTIVRTI